MKKPEQIIDPILDVIYPPPEAVIPQLSTIKAIAASTIKMYEATEEIRSIQSNLKMIQMAIDYLSGMPITDDLKPAPEDTLKPKFIPSSKGVTIQSSINKNGEYDISITGTDIESRITHPELFGEIAFNALEMSIEIPVMCYATYLVIQENPILEHYKDDPNISQKDGIWTKEKEYQMGTDIFDYSFLLGEGRSKVRIDIIFDEDNIITFNITSHVHFKEKTKDETNSFNG